MFSMAYLTFSTLDVMFRWCLPFSSAMDIKEFFI